MGRRGLASVSSLAGAIAIVSLMPIAITGQAPSSSAQARTPIRTAWGEPDLQGVWTNATITPLQRPAEFAGKEFLSDADAAKLEELAEQGRVDRPPREGDPGTYNQLWFDRGTKVVGTRRSSLIVDPSDGRMPALTPAAQRRAAPADRVAYADSVFESWVDIDTGERCLTDGLPMMPYAYNNNFQIFQTPGYVVVLHEMFRDRRIIPTDGRPHVGQGIGQWLGDSRGRWEGNTLVVDTTNFADKSGYVWAADWRASRPSLHLIERFTRVDADTIDYQFTIDDPATYTRQWTAAVPLSKNQTDRGATVGRLFEYACHEGNYSIVHVLSGARAREQAEVKKGSR